LHTKTIKKNNLKQKKITSKSENQGRVDSLEGGRMYDGIFQERGAGIALGLGRSFICLILSSICSFKS
jgi:hypothetical protein